jgi:hypothetical protein
LPAPAGPVNARIRLVDEVRKARKSQLRTASTFCLCTASVASDFGWQMSIHSLDLSVSSAVTAAVGSGRGRNEMAEIGLNFLEEGIRIFNHVTANAEFIPSPL